MVSKKLTLAILCFLLFPVLVFGQLKKDENIANALTYPTKLQSVFGLIGLDPTRFSMSHSFSLSYTSIGGQGFTQGLYLNTMSYQLSNPLTMYLQIGFLNQPFGGLGQKSPYNNKLFLSGAGVEYKPSNNFKVQFEFSQTPNAFYSPYYYNNSLIRNNRWWDKEKDNK